MWIRALRFGTQISGSSQALYWSMAAVGVALVAHLQVLPPWISALIVVTGLWRVFIEMRALHLPPRWLRITIAFAAMVIVFATFRTLNGLEAGTALLAIMTGIKMLETRGVRDCAMLIFIGFVLLFAALLYNQSLLRLPYILASAWLLGSALLRLHHISSPLTVRHALKRTGVIVLQALPLTILLFVFFPRLPGQFWALPTRSSGATGLSEEMAPGDISELITSGAPAFRVTFEGSLPPPAERYWRGPVLHEFDGRRWRSELLRASSTQSFETTENPVRYRISIEPTQRAWVYALDLPTSWPQDTSLRYDFQLIARRPISTLTSFALESNTHYRSVGSLPRNMRLLDTALPGEANPRTREFARELRASLPNDAAFIRAILSKFRDEKFYYTLTPPLLGENSVDEFLFATRRGFCEHFASAFTVLMRAADIPARVVTGYQGGEFNSLGGYLLIRQSDAHAWSEVWLDGRGWVRFDPTAAVAPDRIEKNLDAAISGTDAVPGRLFRTNFLFARARLTWDAVNNFWNNRVVEFDENDQRALMARLGIDDADWRALGVAFGATLALFFVIFAAYMGWRHAPRERDPAVKSYENLCRKLERASLPKERFEGPVDYLTRAAKAYPAAAATLQEACALYVDLRYGSQRDPERLQRLKLLVKQLTFEQARATT